MRSFYGRTGYQTFLLLLTLQTAIFFGLLLAALAPGPAPASGDRIHVYAMWILVATATAFVGVTWSALGEAAFSLDYFRWKQHSKILFSLLVLSPVALIARDVLCFLQVNSTLSHFPLIIVSIAGMLTSLVAIREVWLLSLAQRRRHRRYDGLLSTATETFGSAATRRLADSVAFERGTLKNNPFQMQRGTILVDLPSAPWHSEEEFPWRTVFVTAADQIRAEAMSACREQPLTDYIVYPGLLQGGWKLFKLVDRQRVTAAAEKLCPITVQALQQVPGFPCLREAFFSVLLPGSHLLPHSDESNFWITAHFGVDIPDDCGIRVGRESRKWQPGAFLFLDSSYEHEAWNHSDRPRIVLLFDFLKPALNDAERAFAAARDL